MDNVVDGCKPVVGLCQSMCPENEVKMRESEKLLHWLELEGGRNSKEYRADRQLVIKEYLRPAAGKEGATPADLRPGPVLVKTTTHLIRNVIPLADHPWHEVYEFVFDRLRAIRQDMTIQQIEDSYGVRILEHCTRIMIFAHYRLCEAPITDFDPKINATHIQESLKKLLILYEDTDNCQCNMAEFVSLYLLFNLGSTEALQYGLEMKKALKDNSVFSLALAVNLAWYKHNYVRFLKLVHLLPVICACALHNNRHMLIRQSVCIMCSGYNSKNLFVPLTEVSRILHLNNEEETKSMLELCGLEVLPGKGVKFMKTSFQSDSLIPRTLLQSIDEDLQWEDIPQLLLGYSCHCLP